VNFRSEFRGWVFEIFWGRVLTILFLTNTGRLSRGLFWKGCIGLSVAAGVVSVVLTGNDGSGGLIEHAMIWLLLAYPCINLSIQRFHDRGKSGWWVRLVSNHLGLRLGCDPWLFAE
jgi:uncharacterized membrane protein YhaH (DUF805 family)